MIRSWQGKTPTVPKSCYVDPSAQVLGDVTLGEQASVWMNAVVRGDVNSIRIGAGSNIQDCAVLHGMRNLYPVIVGEMVTIGHNATVHGCVLEDEVLIGIGATVLNDARVGTGSIIAAGAVIPEHTVIPPHSLVTGVPGRVRRALGERDRELILQYANNYLEYVRLYLNETGPQIDMRPRMATAPHVRTTDRFAALLAGLVCLVLSGRCAAQDQAGPPQVAPAQAGAPQTAASPMPPGPDPSPVAKPLTKRQKADEAKLMEDAAEAVRINNLARINGVPYDQPSAGDTFRDYVRDTYGWPAAAKTGIRAIYAQARGKPAVWDFPERLASAEGITVINGNVRYALEVVFHEDLRYLPCHRCSAKLKLENALLAEITARHADDGHRFFTLTPTVADFSGPIIAHATWYPNYDPLQGVISARTVFATRIGGHLFQEFILDKFRPGLKPQN